MNGVAANTGTVDARSWRRARWQELAWMLGALAFVL